jgi:hypothetical protein
MMIIVNNLDNEQITGSVSGKQFSVSYSEKKWKRKPIALRLWQT